MTLNGALTGSGTIDNTGDIDTTSNSILIGGTGGGSISGFTGTIKINRTTTSDRFRFNAIAAGSNDGSGAKFFLSGLTAAGNNNALVIARNDLTVFKMGELSGSGGRIEDDLAATGTSMTLEVGHLGTSTSWSGVFANQAGYTANFAKVGDGSLTLAGDNTYNGTTTISAGKLLVNGTHAGVGAYTVGNIATPGISATLGGSGSTTSAVTVNANGHLAPGNSIGISVRCVNNRGVRCGVRNAWHEPCFARLGRFDQVTGNLDYSAGTLNLINNANNNGQGSVGAGSYKIFTYTGTNAAAFTSINQVGGLLATVVDEGNNGSGGLADGVFLDLYDPALASFDDPLSTVLNLDIGTFNQGTGSHTAGFDIYNLLQTAGFTADMSLLAFPVTGDVAELIHRSGHFRQLDSWQFQFFPGDVDNGAIWARSASRTTCNCRVRALDPLRAAPDAESQRNCRAGPGTGVDCTGHIGGYWPGLECPQETKVSPLRGL